jgi:hypothetical protein
MASALPAQEEDRGGRTAAESVADPDLSLANGAEAALGWRLDGMTLGLHQHLAMVPTMPEPTATMQLLGMSSPASTPWDIGQSGRRATRVR